MRPVRAVALALLGAALAGCFPVRPERPTALGEGRGRVEGPGGADVVQLDVAVVARPYGDRFLNYELWELADEQGVALEHKPVLDDNGFRVCQVGGLPPAGLHKLLSSPGSCPDPRRVRALAGTPVPVPLGPLWPCCAFRLTAAPGRAQEVSLRQAQCVLEVVPTPADEGRVQLRFTPRVRHGEACRAPTATQETPDGPLCWSMETKQPEEAYPALGWELTVGPGEFVVVGTRLDRTDTLGQRCFVPEGLPRLQRLLVLRAARTRPGLPADESLSRSPPLALQASWASARGSAR
jgi:hypothetical protein